MVVSRYASRLAGNKDSDRKLQADNILDTILSGAAPSKAELELFYRDETIARAASNTILKFLIQTETPELKIRKANEDAPSTLAKARYDISRTAKYLDIHTLLLIDRSLASEEEFRIIFGDFTKHTMHILGMHLEYGGDRACLIPSAAHLFRCAATAYHIELQREREGKPCELGKNAAAIMAAHDAGEDLPSVVRDGNGRLYGIRGTQRFINDHVDEAIREEVTRMTNFHHGALKAAEREYNEHRRVPTRSGLAKKVGQLGKGSSAYINEQAEMLTQFILNSDYRDDVDLIKNLKDATYDELFLGELVKHPEEFLKKGIDVTDNGTGIKPLKLADMIKTINKHYLYARKAFEHIGSTPEMLTYASEVSEDALHLARYLVTETISQQEAEIDHLVSALSVIKKLRPMFYEEPFLKHGSARRSPELDLAIEVDAFQ